MPNTVKDVISAVDHVLVFSGDLGHYGGKASLMQLEKVCLIRSIHPSVEVGWDGGATLENVFRQIDSVPPNTVRVTMAD